MKKTYIDFLILISCIVTYIIHFMNYSDKRKLIVFYMLVILTILITMFQIVTGINWQKGC